LHLNGIRFLSAFKGRNNNESSTKGLGVFAGQIQGVFCAVRAVISYQEFHGLSFQTIWSSFDDINTATNVAFYNTGSSFL
jgi:hypothetical protein